MFTNKRQNIFYIYFTNIFFYLYLNVTAYEKIILLTYNIKHDFSFVKP